MPMSIRIITGRAGTGKSTFVHKEIVQDLIDFPLGPPIFMLVPDQMTFQTEYELTNKYGLKGIMRAQVLTFKRLAWFILQETGGIAREKVDAVGYRMMLRRILEEHKDEFTLFKNAAGKPGFTKEIEKLLKEFSQYNVSTQTVDVLIAQLQMQNASQTLLSKMNDLKIVLTQLEARLGTGFIDGDGFFETLMEKLPQSKSIQDAHVYLDGYMAFTGQEFELLKVLIRHAKRTTIVLSIDNLQKDLSESSLFHRPAMTYEKIMNAVMEMNQLSNVYIELEPTVHLTDVHRYENDDLRQIERHFQSPRFEPKKAKGNVKVIEGANPRAEVQAIAREIKRLIQEEGYRYKDIGILYRQADVYDAILTTTFAQHDIPMFSNEKRPMLYHPLIEFARSAFDIVLSNWRYEPVFRAVKTDLFFNINKGLHIAREKMDQLENYCIARGIQGDRWFNDQYFEYRRFKSIQDDSVPRTTAELEREQFLKEQRAIIVEPLKRFQDKVKAAKVGREYVVALFELVDELNIYKKLAFLSKKESDYDELLLSAEHEQAWNSWMNVLEQFDTMFGDKELSVEEAASALQEGYEALQFTSIPPSVDEVTVSTLEYSRFDNMRAIFVIGVNDGVYPMRMDAGGLLSDEEREAFKQAEFELAPSLKSRLMQESYLFYRAIASPRAKLYITFANADDEGKGKLPSIYIGRLHKLFEVEDNGETVRTLPVERVVIDPIEEVNSSNALSYLRHPAPALGFLMMQMKSALVMKEPLTPVWSALKSYYETNETWNELLQRVTKPLVKPNVAEPIPEQMAVDLYGEQFQASVSRIENYYSCPYSHFISYGLRLKERQEFKLETFAMGDLFHDALRRILSENDGLMSKDSTFQDCMNKATDTVNDIIKNFSYQILQSSARYDYIKKKLIKIVGRTLYALLQQHHITQFKPIAHEKSFGMKGLKSGTEEETQIEGLKVVLNNNREMTIRGQIDRIDGYRDGSDVYLRVIDYKSSKHDINLTEVYNGISLQLLTYLEVASQNAIELIKDSELVTDLRELEDIIVKSAGMFYFHVHNPLLTVADYSDVSKLEEERLKQYKLKGYALEDVDVAIAMDETLEPSATSKIVPVGLTKDSTFNGRSSSVLDDEKMFTLKRFVPKKLQQAGNEIYAGCTDIKPYRLGNKKACTYCEYKAICQFDTAEPTNSYNELKSIDKKEIHEKFKQVVNEDE